MNRKRKKFIDLIDENFLQERHYEEMLAYMTRAYDIFINDCRFFKQFSVQKQYSICMTSCLMVVCSETGRIKESKPLTPEKSVDKYDIGRGLNQRKTISITTLPMSPHLTKEQFLDYIENVR